MTHKRTMAASHRLLAAVAAVGATALLPCIAQAAVSVDAVRYVPVGGPVRVTAIGDSITAGVCSSGPSHTWPAVLQTILGSAFTVLNAGNSGKTMSKNGACGPPPTGNCSYWATSSWQQALASTPDIVTIMLGTNDAKTFIWGNATAGNYTADYLDMISILQALPSKPRVYLMSPPPLYPPFPYSMNRTVINGILPSLLPEIASISGAVSPVIDVFDALGGANLTQPNITCDGCHPKDAGYVEIANTVASALLADMLEAGRIVRA